jgi:hypothetical protein
VFEVANREIRNDKNSQFSFKTSIPGYINLLRKIQKQRAATASADEVSTDANQAQVSSTSASTDSASSSQKSRKLKSVRTTSAAQ